jgi:hypothetical protein
VHILIAIETIDLGHAGEWRYLHADRGVSLSRGHSTEGPGREWTLDAILAMTGGASPTAWTNAHRCNFFTPLRLARPWRFALDAPDHQVFKWPTVGQKVNQRSHEPAA